MCGAEAKNVMCNYDKERRRHPRYPFSADVLFGLHDDSKKSLIQYHGHCENISLTGIHIKTSQVYREIKEKIKLQVKIPVYGTKQGLDLIGQVTWCSQDEKGSIVGIQFLSKENKGKEVFLFQFMEDVKKKANNTQNKERRKYSRNTVSTGVELRLQDDSEKHLIGYSGCTKDISFGGICVRIPKHKDVGYPRIKENTRLQVKIPVLDIQKYLELDGQIIWYSQKEKDYNIGIQFISNDEKMKACLSRFIENNK